MPRVLSLVLVLWAAAATAPAQTPDQLLAELRERHLPFHGTPRSIEDLVRSRVASGSDAAGIASLVAKEFGVPAEAAASAVHGVLLLVRGQHDYPPKKIDRAAATRLTREAVIVAPRHEALLILHARTVSWSGPDVATFAEEVLPFVHRQNDPVSTALRLSDGVLYGSHRQVLLFDALRQRPESGEILRAITDELYVPEATISFGPIEVGERPSIRRGWERLPVQTIARSAARQIDALSQLGDASGVMAVLAALPVEVADRLKRESLWESTHQVLDVRADIALAALRSGRRELAAEIAARLVPPEDPSAYSEDAVAAGRVVLLRHMLTASDSDPFDALAAIIAPRSTRLYSGLWAEAFVDVAQKGGYGPAAERALRDVSRRVEADRRASLHYLPADAKRRYAAAIDRFDAYRDMLRARWSAAAAGLQTERTAVTFPAAGERWYRERGVPPAPASSDSHFVACTEDDPCKRRWTFPEHFYPHRVEARGRTIIAVGTMSSEAFGPLADAYWMIRSNDRGSSWERPHCTGLLPNRPYELVNDSRISMVGQEELELEMNIRETAVRSWQSFPPAYERVGGPVLVSIRWSVLRADTDGDSLPDIQERLLLTNGHEPDSDGDALADAADPLPHVARSPSSRAATAMSVAVAGHGYRRDRIVFVSKHDREIAPVDGITIVVLSPAEWARYEEAFGAAERVDLDWSIVNHEGTRALVIWSGRSERILHLAHQDGRWRITRERQIDF